MKRSIAVIAVALCIFATQSTIRLTYDMAGNMTGRSVRSTPNPPQPPGPPQPPPATETDVWNEFYETVKNTMIFNSTRSEEKCNPIEIFEGASSTIKVFPLATERFINISIVSRTNSESMNSQLYNMQGMPELEKTVNSSYDILDLADIPNGIHILSIQYDGKCYVWKIIKK